MPRGLSDYDSAVIQGRLWTPDVLRPNLSLWLDAADRSTIAYSGSTISQWSDKSPNSWNATGGAQTYEEFALNGLPGVVYGGTATFTLSAGTQNAQAMCVVTRPSVTGGGSGFRGLCGTGSASGSGSYMLANNGANLWGTWETVDYSAGVQLQAAENYLLIMDGLNSGTFWRNGAQDGTYPGTVSQSGLTTGFVGGQPAGGQHYSGRIFEVLWLPAAMTSPQRWLIEGYLSWKWGIRLAADHPYANRPPLIGD